MSFDLKIIKELRQTNVNSKSVLSRYKENIDELRSPRRSLKRQSKEITAGLLFRNRTGSLRVHTQESSKKLDQNQLKS
jgi:hypothetical protein